MCVGVLGNSGCRLYFAVDHFAFSVDKPGDLEFRSSVELMFVFGANHIVCAVVQVFCFPVPFGFDPVSGDTVFNDVFHCGFGSLVG